MQGSNVTNPVRPNPSSRHTILRDCGALAIIAILCWGLEGIVIAASIYLTWGPKWNTSAVQTTTTLERLYLFVAPGTLLLALVMRLLGVGLGKTSSFLIAVSVAWCVAIVVASILA
jgi:hypothetical protein